MSADLIQICFTNLFLKIKSYSVRKWKSVAHSFNSTPRKKFNALCNTIRWSSQSAWIFLSWQSESQLCPLQHLMIMKSIISNKNLKVNFFSSKFFAFAYKISASYLLIASPSISPVRQYDKYSQWQKNQEPLAWFVLIYFYLQIRFLE